MIDTMLAYLPNNFIGLFLLCCIFVLGFLFTFTIRKSEWIIYGLLVWFPLESLVLMYTPIDYFAYVKYIPEVIMYGLVGGSLISFVRRKKKLLPRQPLNAWFIGFVLVACLSLIVNWYSPWIWAFGLRQILRFVLMLFVILWIQYDKEILKNMVMIGGTMMVVEIVFGLIQYVSGGYLDQYLFSTRTVMVGNAALLGGLEQFWTTGSRVFATMGRYDQLGSFVALGLVMFFPWIFTRDKSTRKIWYMVAGFAGLVVLFLTSSRASWIAAFVGIAVIGLALRRDRRVAVGLGIFVSIVLIYLVGFALVKTNVTSVTEKPTQSFGERVFEAFSFQAWRDSYDGYGRIFFIINTPRLVVSQYPLFGVGPGQYGGGVAAALLHTDMYDRLHLPFGIQNIYGQIDNNWMSIWGEVGTVGLFIWIMIFVTVIKMSLVVREKTDSDFEHVIAEGLVGLTAGVMCIGFFGPYFEFRTLMFYYWTIVGIVALCWYREKHKGNILEGE